MKMNHSDDILKHTNCLTQQQMQDYLKNNLNRAEVRKVELHLASCDFCTEAMDGLSDMNSEKQLSATMKQMRKHLHYQVNQSAVQKSKRKNPFLWIIISIIIVLIILLLAFFVVDRSIKDNQDNATILKHEQTMTII